MLNMIALAAAFSPEEMKLYKEQVPIAGSDCEIKDNATMGLISLKQMENAKMHELLYIN